MTHRPSNSHPDIRQDIRKAALSVLQTASADEKPQQALQLCKAWQNGTLTVTEQTFTIPDEPSRPPQPVLLMPRDVPKRRGGEKGRIALLHAIAHIEFNAIDLVFDLLARFVDKQTPTQFIDNWIAVGQDEARHFMMINQRLKQLGSFYGALPAHKGMWQAAFETRKDLLGRLAIVPMVLEARGLDVTPPMIQRFQKADDSESALILHKILEDEQTHVAYGVYWYEYFCTKEDKDPVSYYRILLQKYYRSGLTPPFNTQARENANMNRAYFQDSP